MGLHQGETFGADVIDPSIPAAGSAAACSRPRDAIGARPSRGAWTAGETSGCW
jgi:hypothetical protein